jgi:pimeloyl-ACP methyl ester carboxylesterase
VRTLIVYVHGLWQNGGEAVLLRRRLAQALRAEACAFSYRSVTEDAGTSGRELAKYLSALSADRLHVVGHSMGGLVILKAFSQEPALHARLAPGRIVLLGSPLRGSRTARNLAALPFGRRIMGRCIHEEVLEARERRWDVARELGVIAGDSGFGLGRLVGRLQGPSDGTVLVEETLLAGATDRVVLRVGHTGMLFSAAVARAAGTFLDTGSFAGSEAARRM